LDLVENCTRYLLQKIEVKTLKTERVILCKEGIKNDKIFSLFLPTSHFLTVNVNRVQFVLNDSLDATLQKYIVNAYSTLNTAKIIKKRIGSLLMKHPSFLCNFERVIWSILTTYVSIYSGANTVLLF
jgi:predicted neutral ceramidase superfamily lipid hydrolase